MKLLLRSITLGFLCAALPVAQGQTQPDFQQSTKIRTVAFGSCFNPKQKTDAIFEGVLKHEPDVFVFLGDNIYGDTNDMAVLQKKYEELGAVKGFQKLREATTLLATWDDHDFGINDGGKSYTKREESEKIFLDFFNEPADSPRRQRPGVYGSYCFGPPGKVCQILVLDTRYFRDELPRVKAKPAKGTVGWYAATDDPSKTLLGDAQWKWLERQLQVPANLRIIASSIQVLAHEKGMENWGHVPHEQKRLFSLLKKYDADHTFAISGDVHFTELSKKEVDGYPFYDLTSSGMSHSHRGWANALNSFRIGESHWEINAGLIKIDWDAKQVELASINSKGEKLMSHLVKFSEMRFPK